MNSRTRFRAAIDAMEVGFRKLEDQVPRPHIVERGDGTTLRYCDQTISQALLLKLARYLSGLNACDTLLMAGFVQEQGVIQRSLDEIDEAILFLVLGSQDGLSKVHRKYLAAFWQEEFEEGVKPIENTKGRYIFPSDVRKWLEQRLGGEPDGKGAKSIRVVSQFYSGYVHAAAPHIMDMCDGPELRFHLRGLSGTRRIAEHADDLWNYVFRGFLSVICVARSFGDEVTANWLYNVATEFEAASGSTFMADAKREAQSATS